MVGSDIENLRFTTAVSAFMIFTNLAVKKGRVTKETAETFALILSPFAPHLAEELWNRYGNEHSLSYTPWPAVNEEYLRENSYEYPVSFNGKMRFKLNLSLDMSNEEIEKLVVENELSEKWLQGKAPKKVIIVKCKIIHVVV